MTNLKDELLLLQSCFEKNNEKLIMSIFETKY